MTREEAPPAKNLTWVLSQVEDLPTLPQVATRLLALMDAPGTSVKQLQDVISRDPALATKVLRLVNSSYYGMPSRIADIQQAVVILGFKVLRSVVLSTSVFSTFKGRAAGGSKFDRTLFWHHSIGCACIYRYLATKLGEDDPEAAFSIGLLHDVGKLILDEFVPEEMARILEEAEARKMSFYNAERTVLATDHAQIGAWLLEKWKLPQKIIDGVRQHHGDGAAEDRTIAIARFADYLCKVKGIAASGSCDEAHLDRTAWARLEMKREDLPALLREINREIEAANEFLAVATR